MALEIKAPPVLRGKAVREFYKRWASATESKSQEEVQESMHRWQVFFEKQNLFQK